MSDRPERLDWNLVVNAAVCRMKGLTQAETAQKVNRTARTIRNWEDADWWSDAVAEARDIWYADVIQEARSALYLQLKKARDPVRAMQVLERHDPAFAPPKQQVEHSGKIQHDIRELSDDELSERATQLTNRIAALQTNGNGAGD